MRHRLAVTFMLFSFSGQAFALEPLRTLAVDKAAAPGIAVCATFIDGFDSMIDGQLLDPPNAPIRYLSSGGYEVIIDRHQIVVRDPINQNRVEHWGDPHENLNGKHIKDWEGSQRTLLLDDGTRITMLSNGPQNVVLQTSIYDGRQNVQVDNATGLVVHHTLSLADTLCRERTQHDGETSVFTTHPVTGVARYDQVYDEDETFQRTPNTQPLGSTGGFGNPTQVNDLYDDPRLGHT